MFPLGVRLFFFPLKLILTHDFTPLHRITFKPKQTDSHISDSLSTAREEEGRNPRDGFVGCSRKP